MELRTAVANLYKGLGLTVAPDQVLISNGAKHSLHNAMAATLNPGDEVLIPTPYWVSYSDLVSMTGAVPVLLPASLEEGFRLPAERLEKAITPRTKMVLLNSPSNPTGAVYTKAELESIAKVVLAHDLSVISDEIYERLVYDGSQSTCFASIHPDLPARTITISGVSKTYSMTGWRIGWAIGPKPIVAAMGNIQSQETSCPSSISQAAAVTAITMDQSCVEEMRVEFQARRDHVCARINKIAGMRCPVPGGAFYAFFDVKGCLGREIAGRKIVTDQDFCDGALNEGHVCLVPGSAFGASGHARLSFAAGMKELDAGLDALEKWLES
jgi:aspartate aminotransferase